MTNKEETTPLSAEEEIKRITDIIWYALATTNNTDIHNCRKIAALVYASQQVETELQNELQNCKEKWAFSQQWLYKLTDKCRHLEEGLKEITAMHGNEETLRKVAAEYLEDYTASPQVEDRIAFTKWAYTSGAIYCPDGKWRYESDMLQHSTMDEGDTWSDGTKEVSEYTDEEILKHWASTLTSIK